MNATLFNGVSGVLTHQIGLDVTSNNIANVNTVGYRGNTAEFQSFLSKAQYTLDANSPITNSYNWGVTLGATPINMKSGSYKDSDGEFHIAYTGKGWFTVGTNKEGNFDVLNPPMTATQKHYFTRDGQFMRDAEGYLVNSGGYYLYGINLGKIGADGIFNSSQNMQQDINALSGSNLTPIQIPRDVYYRPNLTTEMNHAFNLNRTELGVPLQRAFSNIDGSVNFDAIFAQNMNAFMDANSNPIDVRAHKDFILSKIETTTEQVPNPNFNPNLPAGEDNPETIEQQVQRRVDYPFVYGDSVTDQNGNTKQGFRTLADLRNLLAAQGITLDVQRNEAGTGLEGNGLAISNASDMDTIVSISGSLAQALGLRADNVLLKAPTGNVADDRASRILGSAITVPTYGYSNPIYDAQGNKYSMTNQFYLKQAATGTGEQEIWVVKTSITDAEGKTFYSDNYVESELVFEGGSAVAPTTPISVPFLDGTIALNLTGADGRATTSFTGNASTFVAEAQNGVKAGLLEGVVITENGFIMLQFTNGKQEPMGRVGLAAFVNDQGLKQVGGNLFEMDVRRGSDGQLGVVSGPPLLAWETTGNTDLKYGSVLFKKVELSNVDIANALTELIVYQRGYSFNAKAFTTGDELIKEAIGLKR